MRYRLLKMLNVVLYLVAMSKRDDKILLCQKVKHGLDIALRRNKQASKQTQEQRNQQVGFSSFELNALDIVGY